VRLGRRGLTAGLAAGASAGAGVLALVAGRPVAPTSLRIGPVSWQVIGPGRELGSVRVEAPGEGHWTQAVILRLDPNRVRLALSLHLNHEMSAGAWTVEDAPPASVAAFNAGQFNSIAPWGWTVMNGLELRPPGLGPLSMAVVMDRAGQVRFVDPDSISAVRAAGGAWTALQSYPSLLTGRGEIPAAIVAASSGLDVQHRDARLALAEQADGRLLVLLTRFDGLGEAGGSIPFGLTLNETAQLLRSLGAVRAVALDGGISAQLMVRAGGRPRTWPGWRRVPLGIIVTTP